LVLPIIPIIKPIEIVIDTNVLVAALRSKRGASYKLLSIIDHKKFFTNLSVPLLIEYEDAAKRIIDEIELNEKEIDHILDYICSVSTHRKIYYLWRPYLKDPKDDLVLELAVSSKCDNIITYNKKDFSGVTKHFGINILTPKEFLFGIGEIK
jgi:putative PIN family toxin of toxin-antitoxin system